MDAMDFNIGIEDVGIAVLQELWDKVTLQAISLVSETKELVLEKDSFLEFSRTISELSSLFRALDARKVEAAMGSEFTKQALETLNRQLRRARKIIEDYKSGSRLRLLLHARSILSQTQELAKEIAATVSSFQLVNLDITLNLKTMTEKIINNLSTMELRSAAATENIAFEIEKSITQNSRNQENAVKLLEKIAEAVGASTNASLVQNELALLKQEKEEMEDQKKQAEALQLAQLIEFLYSTEIVTRPQNEDVAMYHVQYPITSFICPLCNEMMTDPVALLCGHSFERKAIQDHFSRGEKNCPTCREELPFLDLTPNVNLRSSIEEWKQRDMDLRFQAVVSGINSNDHFRQNKALEDMRLMIEVPRYAVKAAELGLIPKLVGFLKENGMNTTAILKCLYFLAKYCDDHKEGIVDAGVVRRIVKRICKGEKEPDAIAILLELSKVENLREKIGNTGDCIHLLVSLLQNSNPEISRKSQDVLQNLSSNTSFVVKMAEAGYYKPFVARFNQGPQESRARMAADLTKMQLKEENIKELKDRKLINSIIQMLNSSSPAYKLVSLKCIKKLLAYPRMARHLLLDPETIPHLVGLIRSDSNLKQEAGEIIAILIGACEHSQFQKCQGLQELQSGHNVSLFLDLVANSEPQTKIQFLHLLVELGNKSEIARKLIRSNKEATAHLFSLLDSDQTLVKKWVMKLIQCISDGHPDGVPLPSSPGKESAIKTLVMIFTSSPDTEERSTAAGIISQLPKDDVGIDEILEKSEALKAIHEVMCSAEGEFDGSRMSSNVDTSLLENALAALIRFTEPTKPVLQRQLSKLELYPSLVRVLSKGSSLAKQRTAIALAQLSQSTSYHNPTMRTNQATNSMPLLPIFKFFPNISWCCSTSSKNESLCTVHGTACSARHAFCLVKVDAVKPLVRTLSETESGVAEAALMALETLLEDRETLSNATATIVDSQGILAILQVLEKGSLTAKMKAIDLFHKLLKNTQLSDKLFQKSERILIQLLQEDKLKKKVALVLRQMEIIPDQSSYF